MLRGTWATPELQKAVELGYRIVKIQVWHFREEDRRVGLFADYVNTWLKIKQESAGWPDECHTPEQKDAYLLDYEEKEGIRLEQVAKNPGRKQVAKMMLNSLSLSGRQSLQVNNLVLIGLSISFSLFQLLGKIWRKAKQTADTRHSERPSALLHPERPLLQHQYRPDLLRRSHGGGDDPSRRRGGTKLEDQFIYYHFHNSSCQIEIVLRVRNISTASVVL